LLQIYLIFTVLEQVAIRKKDDGSMNVSRYDEDTRAIEIGASTLTLVRPGTSDTTTYSAILRTCHNKNPLKRWAVGYWFVCDSPLHHTFNSQNAQLLLLLPSFSITANIKSAGK